MEIQNETGLQDFIVDLFNSLSAVKELSELDSQVKSEKDLIKNALRALIQNQDMERCSFFLLNEQGVLINLTGVGIADSVSKTAITYQPSQFKIGEGVIGVAAQTGELQNCQNCQQDKRFVADTTQDSSSLPGSIISVPIFVEGNELIGVLNISHPQAYHFTEWHIRLLNIYKNMLGQLIGNFRLFTQMEGQISQRTVKLEQAITDLQILKDHYQSMSIIDQLTGLYNRRFFYDWVELALAQTMRYGHPLCILMLDLDNFKAVNDDYGHGFGDDVLVKVSAALKQEVRDTDILVRFGGEEFVIIFNNTTGSNGLIFAERIRATIASLIWDEKEGFTQTVSIGLYCLSNECYKISPAKELTIDRLIYYADSALYIAKVQGRNKVVMFTEKMKKNNSSLK